MKIKSTFLFFLALWSCEAHNIKPLNKDMYLSGYSHFISNIDAHYNTFTAKDWNINDHIYRNFSYDWYIEYYNELTADERSYVKKLNVKYHYYKILAAGSNIRKTYEQWLLDAENQFMPSQHF